MNAPNLLEVSSQKWRPAKPLRQLERSGPRSFGRLFAAFIRTGAYRLFVSAFCSVVTVTGSSQTYRWTAVAGTPGFNGAGYLDGTNGNSKFYNPAGLAMDGALNLYVGDTGNNLI